MSDRRQVLWTEFWKQSVATTSVWLVIALPLYLLRGGWGADSWVGLAGYLGLVLVVVLAGHVLPTALLGRVSWPRSALGLLVGWLIGGFVLDVATLGVTEAGGWAVIGVIAVGLPVVALSIALRLLVPGLRPSPSLRPTPLR